MNDGIKKRDDGAWEMDIAAFLPEPEGYLTIGGQSYPIYSFLDLPIEESMKVVQIGKAIDAAEGVSEKMQLSIDHLLALNAGPDVGRGNRKTLTRDQLQMLTPRQIVGLVMLANSIAVPQKAGAESQSESASSAPVSAVSTDGPTAI